MGIPWAAAALLSVSGWCASVGAPRPTAQAAAASLRAAFEPGVSAPLGPQTGALLRYLSFENRPAPGDPVVVQLRAEAAALLKRPLAVAPEARAILSQQVALLNALRDHLDAGQAESIRERYGNMARSRRADLTAMIERTTRDWTRAELGLPQEPVVAAPEEPKTNVIRLTLRPRPTPPERRLKPAGDVVALPEPEIAALTALAKRMRTALGWGSFAIQDTDMSARRIPLDDTIIKRAVMIHFNGSPLMVLTLGLSGVTVGFGTEPAYDTLDTLRRAGFQLRPNQTDARIFHLRHDEALKDAGWFQRWREERKALLGL